MEAAERVAAPVELSQCDSCKRRLCDSHDELHTFSLHAVESGTIRRKGRFKFPHIKSSSGRGSRTYSLCDECKNYLVFQDEDEGNIWPLFLYHLLFGSHDAKFRHAQYHYSVCGGEVLWRLVPPTMRGWWLEEIKSIPEYSGCTADHPQSVFVDKTSEFEEFNRCCKSGKLSKLTQAMDNYHVLMSTVLCPWKYT